MVALANARPDLVNCAYLVWRKTIPKLENIIASSIKTPHWAIQFPNNNWMHFWIILPGSLDRLLWKSSAPHIVGSRDLDAKNTWTWIVRRMRLQPSIQATSSLRSMYSGTVLDQKKWKQEQSEPKEKHLLFSRNSSGRRTVNGSFSSFTSNTTMAQS